MKKIRYQYQLLIKNACDLIALSNKNPNLLSFTKDAGEKEICRTEFLHAILTKKGMIESIINSFLKINTYI